MTTTRTAAFTALVTKIGNAAYSAHWGYDDRTALASEVRNDLAHFGIDGATADALVRTAGTSSREATEAALDSALRTAFGY